MALLPFHLSESEYSYFLDGKLRCEVKGDIETGIIIETEKHQKARAIQALTLYEVANEISEREVRDSDLIQYILCTDNGVQSYQWVLFSPGKSEILEKFNSKQEAALAWVQEVASNPGRSQELGDGYASRFKKMLLDAPVAAEMEAELASVFLRFRGEYINEKGEWKSLNQWCKKENGCNWSVEQQLMLPSSVTKAIYDVAVKERDGDGGSEEEQPVPLENESTEPGTGSTTPQTGQISTGESNSVPSPTIASTTETSHPNLSI